MPEEKTRVERVDLAARRVSAEDKEEERRFLLQHPRFNWRSGDIEFVKELESEREGLED